MSIILYDLAGAEADRRFSPFCWRTRMALAHKGLEVETVPWRFTEKDKLPKPNRGRVPVIVDDDRVVHDSTAIADYLEERYPDRGAVWRHPRTGGARPSSSAAGLPRQPRSAAPNRGAARFHLRQDARLRRLRRFWRRSMGARSAISRCLRPMIRSGSGADACSTCSTASLVAPPPTATERALEYMRAAAGLARPCHDQGYRA